MIYDVLGHEDDQFCATIHEPSLTDSPLETDVNSDFVAIFSQVLDDHNLDSSPYGVPFCSDASKFGAIGIPSIIFGPGNIDQAHAAVEFVSCEEVIRAARFYYDLMRRFQLKA